MVVGTVHVEYLARQLYTKHMAMQSRYWGLPGNRTTYVRLSVFRYLGRYLYTLLYSTYPLPPLLPGLPPFPFVEYIYSIYSICVLYIYLRSIYSTYVAYVGTIYICIYILERLKHKTLYIQSTYMYLSILSYVEYLSRVYICYVWAREQWVAYIHSYVPIQSTPPELCSTLYTLTQTTHHSWVCVYILIYYEFPICLHMSRTALGVIYTHIHTYVHTYIHTYIHIHACLCRARSWGKSRSKSGCIWADLLLLLRVSSTIYTHIYTYYQYIHGRQELCIQSILYRMLCIQIDIGVCTYSTIHADAEWFGMIWYGMVR